MSGKTELPQESPDTPDAVSTERRHGFDTDGPAETAQATGRGGDFIGWPLFLVIQDCGLGGGHISYIRCGYRQQRRGVKDGIVESADGHWSLLSLEARSFGSSGVCASNASDLDADRRPIVTLTGTRRSDKNHQTRAGSSKSQSREICDRNSIQTLPFITAGNARRKAPSQTETITL